jgi:acyl carrier protein
MEAIEEKVIQILKKYTLHPEVWDHYQSGFNLTRDLKINSARIVDIVLDIEEEYAINISNSDIERVKTIAEIIELIAQKTRTK